MELALLALIPFIFLLVAASLLVISQISSFLQFSRFSRRERNNNDIISKYIQEMALAQTQLGKRSRQLEELSRRLKLGNEELARMNSMKSKFLSMAVHDIRTPLTSVRGFSEMLERKGSLGAQERKYLTYIMRATDQIGHLMADLTDLAVIEAGKFRIEKTSLDLAEFVAEALPSIGLIASRKGVILTAAEVPAGVEIEADRFRLGRVLANLLGNAVKFTQPGGRVELRTRVLGPTVIFSIKDTGPGIHPSERRKIFEKFYQSQFMRDVKSRSAGWGLGLAISQEIVRAHSGEIGVDSQGLGKGSTFWVRVPLRAAVRRAAAVAAVALAALVLSGPARAQTIPLDEKAKFEAALEKKAEGVLLRVLGPNRYKVVVDAAVDFTRIEKFEIKEGSVTQRSERSGPYAWTPEPQQAVAELLPGVPLPAAAATPETAAKEALRKPDSYERKNSYPTEFLKRLSVTVVLDRTVTPAETDQIRAMVTDILGITPDRGDELTMISAPFLPLWKTVWYEPEMMGMAIKYLLITLLTVLTLAVVAVCLLKLSDGMREMAAVQAQQMSMDVRDSVPEDPLLELDDQEAARTEDGKKGEAAAPAAEAVVINVALEQVEPLAEMLAGEAPANVALLVTHLSGDIRTRLLAALPAPMSEEVLASLGKVRYVEPEVIESLKEEVERRLAGAVGGIGRLISLIEAGDFADRQRMIETLAARDPELGRRLRERVFLLENLAELDKTEWSLLKAKVSNEDWAWALSQGPQEVVEALRQNSAPGSWQILSQMLSDPGVTSDQRRGAQQRLAQAVTALIVDGKINGLAARSVKRLESATMRS